MAPLRERLAQESVFEAGKPFDGAALSKAVISMANGYVKGLLRNRQDREVFCQLASQCGPNARAYREHGEFANLSWAIGGIEKVILSKHNTFDGELVRAKKYLKLLSSSDNAIISALSNLYLAFVWKLRHNSQKMAWYVLEMFNVAPEVTRTELACALWSQLFLPRFSKLESWHHKEVANLMKQKTVPAGTPGKISPRLSYSFEALYTDLKGFWQQLQPRSGPLGNVCIKSAERLQVLKKLYQESLDANTQLFAKFYQSVISEHKCRSVSFPAVKTPQVRVQIVQREFISRGNLVKNAPFRTKAKENIHPKDENALERSSQLNRKLEGPVLTGSELDESILLRVWSSSPRTDHGRVSDASSSTLTTVGNISPVQLTRSSSANTVIDSVEYPESQNMPFQGDSYSAVSPGNCKSWGDGPNPQSIADLKQAIASLCSAESIQDCEQVVTVIARVWMESKGNPRIEAFLTKAVVIELLMDLLLTSKSTQTQRATICLLTEFVHSNDSVRCRLKSYDPEFKWATKILELGQIPQMVVLLYLLKLSPMELEALNLIPTIVEVLKNQVDSSNIQGLRAPKAAAIFLLEQIVCSDSSATSAATNLLFELDALPSLLGCLHSETPEEQISAMVVLLSCMNADATETCNRYISKHCRPSTLMPLVQCRGKRSRATVLAFVQHLLNS